MKDYWFGRGNFASAYNCRTFYLNWSIFPWTSARMDDHLRRLLDHGFIADGACAWDERLEGHEVAIVARTYCSDDEIDNPPEGLRCVRLGDAAMGEDDEGTAIAIVVTGATEAAEKVLSACVHMPADLLANAISLPMASSGLCVALLGTDVSAAVKIVSIRDRLGDTA